MSELRESHGGAEGSTGAADVWTPASKCCGHIGAAHVLRGRDPGAALQSGRGIRIRAATVRRPGPRRPDGVSLTPLDCSVAVDTLTPSTLRTREADSSCTVMDKAPAPVSV